MMKMPKALCAALVVAGLMSGASQAADSGNIFGIKLPESLDDLGAVAYEDTQAQVKFGKAYSAYFFQGIQHYDDPRLGYSLAYATTDGSDISVYVYNLGMNNLPDGTDLQAVTDQLAQSGEAISLSGRYAKVEQRDAALLSPHFAQTFHQLTTKNGQPVKSYTLLRAQNGFFIKVRITGDRPALEARSADFLNYLAQDLGIENQNATAQ